MAGEEISAEMKLEYDRLQKIADEIEDAISDALHDHNRERGRERLLEAQASMNEFKRGLSNAPYVVADCSICERELEALADFHLRGRSIVHLMEKIGRERWIELMMHNFELRDYLGKAAVFSGEARKACNDGDFDRAWRLYHQIQDVYLQHGEHQNWNAPDTLRLASSVHGPMADMLRKEGRHVEALRHFLYMAMHERPLKKTSAKRLNAFINRAKLPKASPEQALGFIDNAKPSDGLREVDILISEWKGK